MLRALLKLAVRAGPYDTVDMFPVRTAGRNIERARVVTTPSHE